MKKISINIFFIILCILAFTAPSFAVAENGINTQAYGIAGSQSSLTVGGSTNQRELPFPVATPTFNPGSGIFMGPYAKLGDWNALLPDFLLLKDTWTKEDFQRVIDKTSTKGGVELIPMAELNPGGTSVVRVIYDSKITIKDIKAGYHVYAVLTTYASTKKEVSYAALLLKTMEVNFEEVGAPVMIVSDMGDRLGSRTYGWTAGIGMNMSAIQPGAGNFGGNGSAGFAIGSLNSTQSDNPYVRVYLVAPFVKANSTLNKSIKK